jgi:hypothetical protein
LAALDSSTRPHLRGEQSAAAVDRQRLDLRRREDHEVARFDGRELVAAQRGDLLGAKRPEIARAHRLDLGGGQRGHLAGGHARDARNHDGFPTPRRLPAVITRSRRTAARRGRFTVFATP